VLHQMIPLHKLKYPTTYLKLSLTMATLTSSSCDRVYDRMTTAVGQNIHIPHNEAPRVRACISEASQNQEFQLRLDDGCLP